ncbi:hypothetical protein MMC07_004062 [Pseudocyphellaria aurata]|nr:hypothetical protein [Pseudocyphellaria aurata]
MALLVALRLVADSIGQYREGYRFRIGLTAQKNENAGEFEYQSVSFRNFDEHFERLVYPNLVSGKWPGSLIGDETMPKPKSTAHPVPSIHLPYGSAGRRILTG